MTRWLSSSYFEGKFAQKNVEVADKVHFLVSLTSCVLATYVFEKMERLIQL